MRTEVSKPRIQWAAELAHVREVALLGTADLIYWQNSLRCMDLVPVERDGHAQVMIVASDSKYLGVKFRELVFSVLVHADPDATCRDATYLIHAFNSNRAFAFVERVFFSTPYSYGGIRVSASWPASFSLIQNAETVFRAEMAADAAARTKEPCRQGDNGWEGAVFLPRSRRLGPGKGKVFFARLRGHTVVYPFLASQDAATIRPARGSAMLQALVDSHFAAKEWTIREDANHSKSTTYARTEATALARRGLAPAAMPK